MRSLNVLVACEYSGTVRDAFIARGHNAVSVDLLPSESDKGQHFVGDALEYLHQKNRWDLIIAHPPCTRLCNSGVRWLHERNLWDDMYMACELFDECLHNAAPFAAVENPVMHKYAREVVGNHAFTVQPWQFGDDFKKRTCFWTGPDRWKDRSRTYPGIADAIADQWGGYVAAQLEIAA